MQIWFKELDLSSLKSASKVAGVFVRIFIASLFLALPATTAQESQAIVPVSCAAGGVCHVGDIGPAGGTVYYVSSGSSTFSCGPTRSSSCNTLEYFEDFGDGPVGSSFMNSSYPDTPTSSAGTDFETINFSSGPAADLGYGLVNTLSYYTQLNSLKGVTCAGGGYGPGAVTLAVCYSATSYTPPNIWALPSPGEAYMLYKYLKSVTTDTNYNMGTPSVGCTPAIGYSNSQIFNNCFWTSLQSNRSVAVMDLTTGTFAFQPKLRVSGIGGNGMYKIIPVHAFLSTVTSAAPTIASATISGTVKVGQVLTATGNSVTGSPTPTASYEWKAGGSVVGTNSETYTIASGDLGKTITVKITVANTVSPSATATSNPTAAVAVADTAPGITSATISGIDKVGEVLTATANGVTGSPSPTASYEWKAGATVVGTNSSTYTIASGDLGKTITVKITESNGVGSNATATSSPTASVSSSTTSIGSSGDTLFSFATNSSTNLNSVKLTGPGQALQITGYTDTSTIKIVVSSNIGKIGISVTTSLTAVNPYPSNLSESATAIAFSGTKARLNAALNSLRFFAPSDADGGRILFTVTSDGYEPPLTRSINIDVKTSQAALRITNTDLIASIGDTVTVVAVGGSGSGSISYSTTRVGGGDGCVIDENTGVLTTDIDTNCLVVATRAGDGTYSSITSDSAEFVFNPKNQPTPIVIGYNKLVITKIDETITLSATGGNGNGAISFATQSENCYIEGNTIHAIKSGQCDVIATRSPSSKYAIATSQWPTTFFVNITQEVSDSITVVVPTGLKAGETLTLTSKLGLIANAYEDSMEYKVSGTGCGAYDPATHQLFSAKAVTCTVMGYWKASAPFKYQQSPQVQIKFYLKTPATLYIPETYTAVVNQALVITATGGNPDTSTVTYTVTGGAGCTNNLTSLNNGRSISLLVTQPKTYCSVIATQRSDGKYGSAESVSRTLAFGLLSAETLTVSVLNSEPKYYATLPVSLTTSGANGGAITYKLLAPQGSCILESSTVTSNKAELCLVYASQAEFGSYAAIDSAPLGIYFNKISAPDLSLPETVTAKAGKPFTLLATGGIPGVATANFTVSGSNCFNTGTPPVVIGKSVTFTPKSATRCTVTVQQAATDTYNLVSFTRNYSFELDTAPALTIRPETTTAFAGVALKITVEGGNPDTSTVTYTVTGDVACGSGTLSLDKRTLTLTPAVVAYCTIQASQPAAGRYGYVTSSSSTIAFKLGQSPALIIDETVTATAGEEFRFKARGGNGSAISYTVSGTGCQDTQTVSSYLIIRTTAVVYCTIQAKQAETTTLTYAQSAAKSIKFAASDFSGNLLVTNVDVYAGTVLPLTNNAVKFGNQVKYKVAPATIRDSKGNIFTNAPNGCSYNETTTSITNTGEAYCNVYAYWPAGSVYNYKQSDIKTIHFTVIAQSQFSISNISTSVVKTDSFTVTTRGGSGTGAVTYAKKTNGDPLCTLTPNGNGTATLTASGPTTCSITATKEASGKYAKSTSQTVIFTFRKT